MNFLSGFMSNATVYRLWQAPIAERKLDPVRKHNDFRTIRRALDVGCGPGTNTRHFAHAEYLGLDLNEKYIEYARRHYEREFIATDIRSYVFPPASRFDFVLVNSFLHHIDLENTYRILSHLHNLLTNDGHIHILELVMPEWPSISRFLARWDRGNFARPLEEWRQVFYSIFEPVLFQPYPLTAFGITLWNMIYFKGKARP